MVLACEDHHAESAALAARAHCLASSADGAKMGRVLLPSPHSRSVNVVDTEVKEQGELVPLPLELGGGRTGRRVWTDAASPNASTDRRPATSPDRPSRANSRRDIVSRGEVTCSWGHWTVSLSSQANVLRRAANHDAKHARLQDRARHSPCAA
jgi:hypothetical protein